MSWQGQMGTIVRYLVNDTDSANYKYSDHRIETTILVAAQLSQINVDFEKSYSVNVDSCQLTPDPTKDEEDKAFITLVCLKAACIIIGGEIRSEAPNAISVKDGVSAIDMRGVSQVLSGLYKDLCDKHEQLLLEYRSGKQGHAILSPYSPASDLISRNNTDHRSGGYFNY